MSRIAEGLGADLLSDPNFTEDAILVKSSDGTRNTDGIFIPGKRKPTPISVVTAPLSGEDRQQLPEGIREAEGRKFWLRDSISAVREGEAAGDYIRYGGEVFRIVLVKNWQGFSEAIGMRPEDIKAPPLSPPTP